MGLSLIVTEVVATVGTAQQELGAIVYVIVYVPGVLVAGVISPVVVFIVKPTGALKHQKYMILFLLNLH